MTVSESDICLVIANLLENAFEASMKLDRDKRQIKMFARPHSEKILLISVENAFNGEITEKDGFFGSSKRNGNGIGTQSVRRIAEKDGGYLQIFSRKRNFLRRMLCCTAKTESDIIKGKKLFSVSSLFFYSVIYFF